MGAGRLKRCPKMAKVVYEMSQNLSCTAGLSVEEALTKTKFQKHLSGIFLPAGYFDIMKASIP